jgi:predicted dehydrogenase
MFGAAVVGLGVGEQHAAAYLRDPACRLRWVYDLDPDRLAIVRSRLGDVAAADSLSTILHDASTHIVSIASYDDAHFDQTKQALAAGKHVFVEKPLCRTIDELRQIRAAWESSASVRLQSNLVLRSAPLYRWLKAAIEGGELGEVYAFDGEYLYGRLEKITDGWRKDVADYSVMQGGAVHLVDLMLWLVGTRPTRVAAAGNNICTAGTAFRYRDYVAATYEFGSRGHAVVGRVTANFGCVHRHHHSVRVFGTKATFVYDDAGARLHTSRDPAQAACRLEQSPHPGTKGDLIPEFVAAIRDGEHPAAAAQHEFDVISACLAADGALDHPSFREIEYV